MNSLHDDRFIAKAAKALGDPHRIRILREILQQGSINCTQAQHLSNLTQPNISYHIRTLVNSQLVDTDKRGREVYLVINWPNAKAFFLAIHQINSPQITD
jgi:DNA-binding transcriptional ArsR family regulator